MIRPFIFRFLFVWLGILLCHNVVHAKQLVRIKVYPENVGVFYNLKKQQFQAIAIFDDGSQADYTTKVGWSLKPYPLPSQKLEPDEVATINDKGLLTVKSSWGRIKVSATYPPPDSAGKLSPLVLNTLLLAPPALNVAPANGPLAGTNSVAITSENVICVNDADLQSVLLANIPATSRRCQDAGHKVVVTAGSADAPGLGDVVVNSSAYGKSSKEKGYRYNSLPTINSVQPGKGPLAGGNNVTISGLIGGGAGDIKAVRFGAKTAVILSQQSGAVVVSVPAGTVSGPVRVEVDSIRYGTAGLNGAYTYNPPGVIDSIIPSSGPLAGTNSGGEVVISGTNLGSGSDITSVKFGSKPAVIKRQTAASVTVAAPAASSPGPVDVHVSSKSYGTATKNDGFTYNPLGSITTVIPRSGPLAGGNQVLISGTNLCGGDPCDKATVQVWLKGIRAAINSATRNSLVVTPESADDAGTGKVVVISKHYGIIESNATNDYTYNPSPSIISVYPNSGSVAGGNTVTITGVFGGGSGDITGVLFGAKPAALISQKPGQVVVRAPAGDIAGLVRIEVASTSYGPAVRVNGYTYNADGYVTSVDPAQGSQSGGEYIGIYGQLGNVTRVTICGVAAVIELQPDEQSVIVRTGAYAGTVPATCAVEVVSADRNVQPLVNGFTYLGAN